MMLHPVRIAALGLLLVTPVLAAEKEDPAKFKYRNLPVEASCLEGYHPTIDAEGNKVFPCIANAEIVAPSGSTPVKANVAAATGK